MIVSEVFSHVQVLLRQADDTVLGVSSSNITPYEVSHLDPHALRSSL